MGVHSYEFTLIKVRLQQSDYHGYQWCVRSHFCLVAQYSSWMLQKHGKVQIKSHKIDLHCTSMKNYEFLKNCKKKKQKQKQITSRALEKIKN